MIVKINNATVTIKGNPTLERNIKEEFDTAKIVIESTRQARYEMYDTVDITTPYEDTEQYLIQADNPIQLNATTYQHNLTLFENIAFFNTVYPADRSFKLVGQTLEDVLTAYQRELGTYNNIDITWSTIPQAVLDETIPFKEFAGLNLSSILLSLFRKIWAVPKVNRVGDVWDIYPLYHNERNNSISSESISKMSQQNNVDYATKVKSQLKNTVNERLEGEVTWFPSAGGYVLPRSSSLEKIQSKLRYELDSDIISILKVEVVDISMEIYNQDTTSNEYPSGLTFDITDRIITDDLWDTIKSTTETSGILLQNTDNAKNYIRYKVGQPYITNLYESGTDGIIFTVNTTYLTNAIERVINLQYNETGNYQDAIIDQSTEDIKMRFKYVRQRNIDLVHNRKTKGAMNDTTTIHTQRDSSVELNEYKKNLKIYSNRMGNNEFTKTKVFVYPDEPYELFDYTDNKTIVTRVQNTYHNKFVYCEYEESVDFSNIEAEYALMRRADPYTINAKAVTTNLIRQEFVEFSILQRDLETRFEDDAKELLVGLFDNTPIALEKVAVGVFKPVLAGWNTVHAIHMPVEASGDGNLITVHVQFPHQTIAGKTYYDLDTSTYQNYLNPLPYTDEDGRLEDFKLFYTPDVLFEDSGQYPLILSDGNYYLNKYTTTDLEDPLDLDSAASFAQTLQISFVADENIYIGNSLARDNFFVKDQVLPAPAIKLYTSTKPYGQYDQAPRTYDTDNTANITYNYSFANRTITITPSIDVEYLSIVRNDKILLTINKSIGSGETLIIYINFVKEQLSPYQFEETLELNIGSGLTIGDEIRQLDVEIRYTITKGDEIQQYNQEDTGLSLSIGYSFKPLDESQQQDGEDIGITAYIGYSVTIGNEVKQLNQEETLGLDIGYTITTGSQIQQLNQEETKSLSIGYATTIDSEVQGRNYEETATAISSGVTLTTGSEVPLAWVSTTATATTPDMTCDELTDDGNVKIISTETTCAYIETNSYPSSTDVSTTIPACSDGATYTLCFFNKDLLIWACKDYEGATTTTNTYVECKIQTI